MSNISLSNSLIAFPSRQSLNAHQLGKMFPAHTAATVMSSMLPLYVCVWCGYEMYR